MIDITGQVPCGAGLPCQGTGRYVTAICIIAGLVAIAGCGGTVPTETAPSPGPQASASAGRSAGHSAALSPREAFERARQAAAAGQWRTFCDYLTPKACDTLAVTLMILGDQIVQRVRRAESTFDADRAERLRERIEPVDLVLRRYRIPPNVLSRLDVDQLDALAQAKDRQLRPELLQPLVKFIGDRAEFAADMLSALPAVRGRRTIVSLKGELAEVTQEGDVARAVLVAHDEVGIETRRELEFRRLAGDWRIDFRLR